MSVDVIVFVYLNFKDGRFSTILKHVPLKDSPTRRSLGVLMLKTHLLENVYVMFSLDS